MLGAGEGSLALRSPDEPEQIGHRPRAQGCGPEATYIWIRRNAPVARAGEEVRLNVQAVPEGWWSCAGRVRCGRCDGRTGLQLLGLDRHNSHAVEIPRNVN